MDFAKSVGELPGRAESWSGWQIEARDAELENKFGKDAQIAAIRNARGYLGRLLRRAKLHRILDSKAGPLIAVRLNILIRKTLGGLATDPGPVVITDPRRLREPFLLSHFSGRAAGRAAAK